MGSRVYPLDYEVVVKAYGPVALLKYFGAVFDTNGDVVDITNKACFVRGLTSGGAREVQIMRDIPIWEKIVEIRRVCEKGYGKPFAPNESSKHAILEYHRKNPSTGEIEPWHP